MLNAIDYMLEPILLGCYLLIIIYWYLIDLLDVYIYYIYYIIYINIISENNSKPEVLKYSNIQSAENHSGFSETIRQSNMNIYKYTKDEQFWHWFAGIIDGDGNFDIRNINGVQYLKTIRIKLHVRDIRIISRIQNYLHIGRINLEKTNPYVRYNISKYEDIKYILNNINGLIRLKTDSFKLGCILHNIKYIEPNYTLAPYDPYFAGLIDTDGSIIFNYNSNRIECYLEVKDNEYSTLLNLDYVIPGYTPYVLNRTKTIKGINKIYLSKLFRFQTVKGMPLLFDYFMHNRLYCDFKFYRISKIPAFIEIRNYKKTPYESNEYLIYSRFILNWIKYKNPKWDKIPFVKNLRSSPIKEIKL